MPLHPYYVSIVKVDTGHVVKRHGPMDRWHAMKKHSELALAQKMLMEWRGYKVRIDEKK